MKPAVEWIRRPRRPKELFPSNRRHEVVGQPDPFERRGEDELARVEDERRVAVDLDQLGQVLLRLLDVDVRVTGVVEDAEVAVDADVDARRLEQRLVVGVDPDAPLVDQPPDRPVGENHGADCRVESVIVRSRTGLAEPLLALTFDDGPSEWTEPILDLFGAHGARTTFFIVGSSIGGREPILERARAEGHELGSHTFWHAHPAALDDDELREEIRRGASAVGSDAKLVRPPYGEDPERFDRLAEELGLGPTVLWSVDPRDWEAADPDMIVGHVLADVTPGAIVDLHDGRRPQPATVAAVEVLLPALRERGFRLVTVSELLET